MTTPAQGHVSHATLAATVPAVLAEWRLAPATQATPVAGGTLNWNFDVRTAEGRFFLRCYRANLETERISGEHDLLRWVVAVGSGAGAADDSGGHLYRRP